MATPIEPPVLTLVQWLSPAFPIGAFAYSHGLEAAVDQGWVSDAAGVETWLRDVLECGAGQSDARLLAAAYRSPGRAALAEIDAQARAFAASGERLLETDLQGAAFCRLAREVWGLDLGDLVYPVALGAAAAREGLPLTLTKQMYLQAFASSQVAAAQRLLPVGQTEGQVILRRLAPLFARLADATRDGDLTRLAGSAFLADVAAMKHETQYSRIFRT